MLDVVTNPLLCPHVTVIEQGPRFTAKAIITALPPKATPQNAAKAQQSGQANPTWATDDPMIVAAVDHFKVFERRLWEGDWQNYKDPLTGEQPFPSQSEADYYFARSVARWAMCEGISDDGLESFVEAVFEQSALAQREKWQGREDYRQRTISTACANLTRLGPKPSTSYTANSTAEPDWSLKGDLIGARFFKDRYLGKMVFVVSVGKWLRWEDANLRWRWCELGEHIEAAKDTVLDLYRIALQNAAKNPDAWKGITTATANLQVESRIHAILELAKSEPGMSILADALDSHPELLGVRNGVVDLRTGVLRQNDPLLYITKHVEQDYQPSATCPTFMRFLDDVFQGDAATVSAVQRLVGLTLTGCVEEEVIIFCVGTGANGKSIFGNVLTTIMGQYSTTAPSSLLAARRADDHSARSDLAMLHGARIVSINELPGGMMLDENVTKQLAGREPISARFLYREHFTFLPRFTPWVRTNHRPIIKGTDNGIWRRMRIVPFRRTFTEYEQDKGLEAKIMREAEGVLAWMIEGAKLYLRTGLTCSSAMKAELAQYRSDSDLLGEFLSEKTEADIAAEVLQCVLYATYNEWCGDNGLKPVSKRVLTEQLTERGFGQRKSGSGRYYTGLKLSAVRGG